MDRPENNEAKAPPAGATTPLSRRTVRHLVFSSLLVERGPKNFTFAFDQSLGTEPQRADVIVMRRAGVEAGEAPRVLRRLWNLLSTVTVGEYKSPTRPIRKGELPKLIGYGAQYHALHAGEIGSSRDLTLALFVASWTPTLSGDLAVFGWTVEPLGDGYYRVQSAPYALYVAVLDEVSVAEKDGLLDLVGHRTMDSVEARQWWAEHVTGAFEGLTMKDMEGYDELMKSMVERLPPAVRLEGLSPAVRVEGLKPEERLAGLDPDDQILALSDEVIATFPAAYLATLSARVQAEIARRLTRH